MEINQLRYFLEVCKTGSMSKAASNLYITQQGISIALRRLEEELGTNLFFHKSRKLLLTEFGQAFKQEAEIVITHIDKLYELARAQNAEHSVNITVALTKGRMSKLPSELQQLLIAPPEDYHVHIINDYASACADMVYDESATFGLVYGNFSDTKFDTVLLQTVPQTIIVNKNHPFGNRTTITVEELDNLPFLLPDRKTQIYASVNSMFQRHGVHLNLAYECNAPHEAVSIISKNPNLVGRVLSSDITKYSLEYVTALRLEGEDFTIPFNLVTKKGRKLNVYEQLFKRMILDAYGV